MRPTALFRLYHLLSSLALPFVARYSVNKLRKAGVPIHRAHERLGHATQPRRLGPLIWFHAASLGEAKSVLPLITHLLVHQPDHQILLTTGTANSATGLALQLPQAALHQFAPLDGVGPIKRFLNHWRPDLCVLVESELWPNLLDTCARRAIPVALINARLSEKSTQAWRRFPATTDYVLRGIQLAHCQTSRTRDDLRSIGLKFAQLGQNLKSIIGPPSLDPRRLDAVRTDLANRPVWVAASTHEGEEEGVLDAQKHLLQTHPNLCLILVPRHPERADKVLRLIKAAGLTATQRSNGGTLADHTQVYLADTIGETDLWFALSPIVFLGGSWTSAGGHNPFEPAAAHTAIVHGPKFENFVDSYEAFIAREASIEVVDSTELTATIEHLLTDPGQAARLAANARPLAQTNDGSLDKIARQLLALEQI